MRQRWVTRLRVVFAVLRVTPVEQVLLRAALLLTGGAALVVAQGGWSMPGGVVVLVGAAGLLGALAVPDSPGAGVVLGCAVLAWLVRFGLHQPVPPVRTVVLAGLLYLFHTTAALLAVLPPAVRIEPAVLLRWYARAGAVLAVTGLAGAAALALGRVPGGILVDLAGLVGATALGGLPVLLVRRVTGRRGQD